MATNGVFDNLLIKGGITGGNSTNLPQFGGNIWYVDGVGGNDSNSGEVPGDAFLTIGKGITEMASGDALNIRAGTYTETGLDLNKNACELWFEIGAILDPATGTALTISAHYCRVTCPGGALRVTPGTDETGVATYIRLSCTSTDTPPSGVIHWHCKWVPQTELGFLEAV
jgi:hypothetical protein